jgi:hypothetical protein
MGSRAMPDDRCPQVTEAAYQVTREHNLSSPSLASLGSPLAAASAG